MNRRNAALDGLRGLAATVVVVHHLLLATSPVLADALDGRPTTLTGLNWALVKTPLRLVWDGPAAVVVFFVLSGFVLALRPAGGEGMSIADYYPRRIIRLYIPVWGALLFAAVLHQVVDHHAVAGATWWLNAHSATASVRQGLHEAILVKGAGAFALDSVLWSLRWEVLFSLLLPLVVLVMARTRRWIWISAVVALVLVVTAPDEYLRWLPVFWIGSLLAFEYDRIEGLLQGRAAQIFLVAAAIVGFGSAGWAGKMSAGLTTIAAIAIVLLPLTNERFATFLTTRPMHWLGTRSFSLYLVHEPIVVSIAFLLSGTPSLLLLAVLAIPVALVVTEIFFRAIEMPSHRLSRYSGQLSRRVTARVRPA